MKRLVVLGGGESGVGAAILGLKQGYEVLLSDGGELQQKYRDVLLNNEIAFEEGKHSVDLILKAEVVVKSPGIPDSVDLIQRILKVGISVISEIEWASKFTNAKLIAITGSNGKTTTTSMIYHVLKTAGLNVGLAGNIGKSFAWQVADETFDTYVLELSSFQLDGIEDFKPAIAVLLNITPDHLDRYNYDVSLYAKSKFRIAENMDDDGVFIHSAEDPLLLEYKKQHHIQAAELSFGLNAGDARMSEDELCGTKGLALTVSDLKVKGKHNYSNALATVLVGETMGLANDVVCESLKTFAAIEHRMEKVKEVEGVEYINDSKATNVDAVFYALDAMTKKVVWIVGGVDKGNDYEVLSDLVKEKVKGIVCLGNDNEKLKKEYKKGDLAFVETNSAGDAVKAATKLANKGDVVLLSPACASFDLFKSYEDRGIQFKEAINKL